MVGFDEPVNESLKDKLSRLASVIPGYAGYVDRDRRRDADKRLRVRVADYLGEAVDQLQALEARLSRELKLDDITEVDRAASDVRAIRSRCEHAEYGASGIFDQEAIDSTKLAALYEHDLKLLELAEAVVERSHKVATAADEQTATELGALASAVAAFGNHLSARESLLAGSS